MMSVKKHAALAFFCLSLAACSSRLTSAQSVQLLLQGRFAGNINEQTGLATLPVTFSWPASSVFTTFTGDSVHATLTALPPADNYNAYSRFAFYVDEQQVATESTTPTQLVINWSSTGLGSGISSRVMRIKRNLKQKPPARSREVHPAGSHNLTITKLSEASYGS